MNKIESYKDNLNNGIDILNKSILEKQSEKITIDKEITKLEWQLYSLKREMEELENE